MNTLEMMKNLQQIQETMKDLQEKMKILIAEGSAGGDLVKVSVNGQLDVMKVTLGPECVDPRDIPMLEDLIRLAVNDAMNKVKEKMKSELGPLAQGGFPGIPGL